MVKSICVDNCIQDNGYTAHGACKSKSLFSLH